MAAVKPCGFFSVSIVNPCSPNFLLEWGAGRFYRQVVDGLKLTREIPVDGGGQAVRILLSFDSKSMLAKIPVGMGCRPILQTRCRWPEAHPRNPGRWRRSSRADSSPFR